MTPCTATESVDIDKLGTVLVRIAAKGEFSFRDNAGAMVRVTKWTGRDAVAHIQIRPQVVRLDENSSCEIEIYNPLPHKQVAVARHDKVACISVLSCPPSSEMYDAMDASSPDDEAAKRWFKVSAVVLHRKGILAERGAGRTRGCAPWCCCVCDNCCYYYYYYHYYYPSIPFFDNYLLLLLLHVIILYLYVAAKLFSSR